YSNQRADEVLHPVERGFARNRIAQRAQLAIGEVLLANRASIARAMAPGLERIAAAEANIEAAFDEQLLILAEAGEFAQLGDGQRCRSCSGHGMPFGGLGANLAELG